MNSCKGFHRPHSCTWSQKYNTVVQNKGCQSSDWQGSFPFLYPCSPSPRTCTNCALWLCFKSSTKDGTLAASVITCRAQQSQTQAPSGTQNESAWEADREVCLQGRRESICDFPSLRPLFPRAFQNLKPNYSPVGQRQPASLQP